MSQAKARLLYQAAQDLKLDLARSYLIGDAVSDIEAALAAGCRPILVLTGRGREQHEVLRQCGFDIPVVRDLADAVTLIQTEQGAIPSTDPQQ
ncbi:MAG: HAD hydrolase-like protein [Anaerolineae bacterium]